MSEQQSGSLGKELRNGGAGIVTLFVGVTLTAIVAVLTGIVGGGLIAAIVLFIVGSVMSFGIAGVVMIFTSLTKRPG